MRLTRLAIATARALFVLLWSTGFIGAALACRISSLYFSGRAVGFRRADHGRYRNHRECAEAGCR